MQGPVFYYLSVGPYQIDIVKLAPSCLSCILVKHALGIHLNTANYFCFRRQSRPGIRTLTDPTTKWPPRRGPIYHVISESDQILHIGWIIQEINVLIRCWKVLTSCYNVAIWYEMYISRNWITFLINAFKLKTIKFD